MKVYFLLLLFAALAYCKRSKHYLVETKDDADDVSHEPTTDEEGMDEPVIGNNQRKHDYSYDYNTFWSKRK